MVVTTKQFIKKKVTKYTSLIPPIARSALQKVELFGEVNDVYFVTFAIIFFV